MKSDTKILNLEKIAKRFNMTLDREVIRYCYPDILLINAPDADHHVAINRKDLKLYWLEVEHNVRDNTFTFKAIAGIDESCIELI